MRSSQGQPGLQEYCEKKKEVDRVGGEKGRKKEGGEREEQMVEREKKEGGRKGMGREEKERGNNGKEKRKREAWDLNTPPKDRTLIAGRHPNSLHPLKAPMSSQQYLRLDQAVNVSPDGAYSAHSLSLVFCFGQGPQQAQW